MPRRSCLSTPTGFSRINQLLADALRGLYKKHHWQVLGSTFYQLHLLCDTHYSEKHAFVDAVAERIQMLCGVSLAMAADIGETTRIPRPPKGRLAAERGDEGTNDLIVSEIISTNEMQVWFLAEHLVETRSCARSDQLPTSQ